MAEGLSLNTGRCVELGHPTNLSSYAEAYKNLGAAYCELGDWAAAIPSLEAALLLRPDFSLARNNLAWLGLNVRSDASVT